MLPDVHRMPACHHRLFLSEQDCMEVSSTALGSACCASRRVYPGSSADSQAGSSNRSAHHTTCIHNLQCLDCLFQLSPVGMAPRRICAITPVNAAKFYKCRYQMSSCQLSCCQQLFQSSRLLSRLLLACNIPSMLFPTLRVQCIAVDLRRQAEHRIERVKERHLPLSCGRTVHIIQRLAAASTSLQ